MRRGRREPPADGPIGLPRREGAAGNDRLPIDHRPELLPDASSRERRGQVELIAVVVVILALLALAVWFFFFAHNPLLHS